MMFHLSPRFADRAVPRAPRGVHERSVQPRAQLLPEGQRRGVPENGL